MGSPQVFYYGLSARVEAHELSEVVARDGNHLLVLGLEELDKLHGRAGSQRRQRRQGGDFRGKRRREPGISSGLGPKSKLRAAQRQRPGRFEGQASSSPRAAESAKGRVARTRRTWLRISSKATGHMPTERKNGETGCMITAAERATM